MDFTELLPPEIFHIIISYLDGDDIFPCLGVCSRWRSLLNYEALWKKLCLKSRIFDPVLTSRGDMIQIYEL